MYVLDFLRGFPNLQSHDRAADFEYRLLCSGELYNANVLAGDWRKSDVTRIIFQSPFTLIVCSQPFNEFPQELALRFSVPYVRDESSSYYPDEDVARDLSALLTLLCRRLVTVTAKVRVSHPKQHEDDPGLFHDWPIGFFGSQQPVHWPHRGSTILWGSKGIEKITDYNPPPLPVDAMRLRRLLLNLPNLPTAESVILSARLYSLALQQIDHDIDIAYQLLFVAAESMANAVYADYKPSYDDMAAFKTPVKKLAMKFGLPEHQAKELAVKACGGMNWTSQKFTKFIVDYTTDDLWTDDDLFKFPSTWLPARDGFKDALTKISDARGKLLHGGKSFPPSAGGGVGPTAPMRTLMSFVAESKPFPPIVWFERVVNYTLNTFIARSLPEPGLDADGSAEGGGSAGVSL